MVAVLFLAEKLNKIYGFPQKTTTANFATIRSMAWANRYAETDSTILHPSTSMDLLARRNLASSLTSPFLYEERVSFINIFLARSKLSKAPKTDNVHICWGHVYQHSKKQINLKTNICTPQNSKTPPLFLNTPCISYVTIRKNLWIDLKRS